MQRRLVKALEDLVTHYDGSVRNSRGDIIQFIYGDDGLDPVNMEEHGIPANLERVFASTTNIQLSRKIGKMKSEDEKMEVDQCSAAEDEQCLKIEKFRSQVTEYLNKWTTEGMAIEFINKVRDFCDNLSKKLEYSEQLNAKYEKIHIFKITGKKLKTFFDVCYQKYVQSKLDPGTAIGSICAQSIGKYCFIL